MSADQPLTPAFQTPASSFPSIANDPAVTQPLLVEFLQIKHKSLKTPPDMPSMLLSDRETGAVSAYIMRLRETP